MANAYLREVDGVPLGAAPGTRAMGIEVPGNTWNSLTNQLYEEPRSLDDLVHGGGGGTHGISAKTRAEFEVLRAKCVAANFNALRGTK